MCQLAGTGITKMTKTQCIPLKRCESSEAYSYLEPSEETTCTSAIRNLPACMSLLLVYALGYLHCTRGLVHVPIWGQLYLCALIPSHLLEDIAPAVLSFLLDYFPSLLDHSCPHTCYDISYLKIISFLNTIFSPDIHFFLLFVAELLVGSCLYLLLPLLSSVIFVGSSSYHI